MEPSKQPALVEHLCHAITDEAIKAMGMSPATWPSKVFARLVQPVTQRFARLATHLASEDLASEIPIPTRQRR
jgi:hypothetical protein